MNGVSDQIEWLRDAIQDRKAKAESAGGGHWEEYLGDVKVAGTNDYVASASFACEDLTEPLDEGHAHHIAANDPRDTIARCDSDLAILDMAEREIAAAPERSWDWDSADDVSRASTLEDVVRLLAQGYRHRPGYPFEDAAV